MKIKINIILYQNFIKPKLKSKNVYFNRKKSPCIESLILYFNIKRLQSYTVIYHHIRLYNVHFSTKPFRYHRKFEHFSYRVCPPRSDKRKVILKELNTETIPCQTILAQ